MRAILTGYRGLIGHEMLRHLKQVMPVQSAGRSSASDVILDLAKPQDMAFAPFAPEDVFIHAAGITDEELSHAPEAAVLRATIAFDALLASLTKTGLRRFIYVSSAHVLGVLEGKLSEASIPNPMSMYALMHFAGEQLLKRYHYQGKLESVTILRPCAVYGMPPDLEQFARWSLIPYSFPKEMVEKQTITLLTPGLQERNFVSTETIARIVCKQVKEPFLGLRVIHPRGHATESVLAFAKRCATLYEAEIGKPCKVIAPAAGVAVPPPLAFHSQWDIPEPEQALTAYLQTMIHSLAKIYA